MSYHINNIRGHDPGISPGSRPTVLPEWESIDGTELR